MADDFTEKQLQEIEKTTGDLARTLAKVRSEIEKSGKETDAWFDATKSIQSATEGVNKAQETQRNIGQQILKNLKKVEESEKETIRLINVGRSLKAELRNIDRQIATEQVKINDTSLDVALRAAATQRKQQLQDRAQRIQGDKQENERKIAGNRIVVDALKAQDAVLKGQGRSATKLIVQERARKKEAELLKKVYDNLFGPLLGDSKEFQKIASLGSDLLKDKATAYLAIIKASVERWKELDKAAGDFRDKTGFLVSQTYQLDKAAREVNVQMAHLGVGLNEAYAATGALTEQFQVVGLVTKDMIGSTAQMAANLGIAVGDSAKFRGLFTSIAKSSGSTADTLMQSAAALAEMGGVAPSAVLKDMAEASSDTLAFFAKSPMALMRASVEARRLGTTVNSVSKSARGFLNYQESITDELTASALIGKSLNFQEARAAAYAGDAVKSRELALKQIEKAGDFTKMNVYQQEALAKAAGMTVDEVIKQQNQQKMLAELRATATGEEREMLEKYDAMQKQIADNEKDAAKNLAKRGAEMVRQQMRQSEMNKLTNAFSAIWTDISDSLLGIANAIMPPILITARLLGSVFKIIGTVIRGFLAPFDRIGKSLRSGAEGGLKLEEVMSAISNAVNIAVPYIEKLAEVVGYAVNAFAFLAVIIGKGAAGAKPFVKIADIFESIATRIGTWADKLKGIFRIFSPVLKGFQGISKFLGSFTRLLGPIGLVISALQVIWEWGKSIIEILSSDDMDPFEKFIAVLAAFPKAIWNALVQPIIDGVAWILNKIWPGLGDKMIDGIKSIGTFLYDALIQPFVDVYQWLNKTFLGNSPSEIGLMIVDGLKSVGSMIIDVLTFPFRTVFNFISGIFGGDGSLGDTIIGGLKTVMGGVFDILISPFKAAFGFIKKIPLIGKLFGGGDAAGSVNADIQTSVQKQVAMAVEIKNLDDLKETIEKLTDAIATLGGAAGGASPVVNVNNNQVAVADKLDELIGLLKAGAIGIELDGVKVSKAIAPTA